MKPASPKENPQAAPHDHDAHHRHLATVVAAFGTLAAIVALWALLLPTQLAGTGAFGVKGAAGWLSAARGPQEGDADTFQEALARSQAVLQEIEDAALEQARKEGQARTVRQEAESLRSRLETSVQEEEPKQP